MYLNTEVGVIRRGALGIQVSAVDAVDRHGNKDEIDYDLLGGMPSLASIEQSGMGIMREIE